jgi:hypothetical protein
MKAVKVTLTFVVPDKDSQGWQDAIDSEIEHSLERGDWPPLWVWESNIIPTTKDMEDWAEEMDVI